MSKDYICERIDGKVGCEVISGPPGQPADYMLKNIGLHSPDGFEMGYAGSGPSDLALTILCDHLGVEHPSRNLFMRVLLAGGPAWRAWRLHQSFKLKFIAPNQKRTTITTRQIQEWIERQELGE